VVGVGLFKGWYMDAVGGVRKGIHLDVAVLSVGVAVLGILLAWSVFVKGYISPERGFEVFGALHTTFKEQFFTEKIYHRGVARGYFLLSRVLHSFGDRFLIDGFINLSYRSFFRFTKDAWKSLDIKSIDIFIHWFVVRIFRGGRLLSSAQTGLLNAYVLFTVVGVALVLGIMLYALGRIKG